MAENLYQRLMLLAIIGCSSAGIMTSKKDSSVEHLLARMSTNENEVIFILDRSRMISPDIFYKYSKKMLWGILRYHTNLGTGKTSIAVLMFNDNHHAILDNFSDKNTTKCHVMGKIFNDVKYDMKNTQTNGRLFETLQRANEYKIHTPVPRAILLFSAGNKLLNKDEIAEIKTFKRFGTELYVIGLEMSHTKSVDSDDLAENADVYMTADQWVAEINRTSNLQNQALSWTRYFQETDEEIFPVTQFRNNGNLRAWNPEGSLVDCGKNSALYCDNVSGGTQCMCDPGYHLLQDGNCIECGLDSYKPSFGNGKCISCPGETTTTDTGQVSSDQCICNSIQQQACQDRCDGVSCPANADCSNGTCNCKPGWEGRDCSSNSDDCVGSLCHEGGCVDFVDGYMCFCPWHTDGPLCEKSYEECGTNACYNGATCRDGNNDYTCDCLNGTCDFLCGGSGEDCGTKAKDCNVTGENCETDRWRSMLTWREWILYVALPIAGVLLIAIVTFSLTIKYSRKNYKKRNGQKQQKRAQPKKKVKPRAPDPIPDTAADQDDRDYTKIDEESLDGYPNNQSSGISTTMSTRSSNLSEPPVPAQPPVLLRQSLLLERHDDEYQNVPLDCGMKKWRGYFDGIMHENRVTKFCMLRLGHNTNMYTSSGHDFLLSESEAYEITTMMSTRAIHIQFEIKGLLYDIVENSNNIMVGMGSYALGGSMIPEVICVAKSRDYFIVATADRENDQGQCKAEVQHIQLHLDQYGS